MNPERELKESQEQQQVRQKHLLGPSQYFLKNLTEFKSTLSQLNEKSPKKDRKKTVSGEDGVERVLMVSSIERPFAAPCLFVSLRSVYSFIYLILNYSLHLIILISINQLTCFFPFLLTWYIVRATSEANRSNGLSIVFGFQTDRSNCL